MQKINSIQYLRAIAVLLVMFSHVFIMRDGLDIARNPDYINLQTFGAIGVDIFFVISGFIITYTAAEWSGRHAAVDFAKRRIIRIAPAYYIASALYLARIGMSVLFQSLPGAHREMDWPTIIKTITILPIFDNGGFQSPILAIGWTLSFEFLFYLIFTFIILSKNKNRDGLLLSIIAVLGIVGIVFPVQQVQLKFITNPIILEFAFGVLISILYKKGKLASFKINTAMLITSLLLFASLIYVGFGEIGSIDAITNGNLSTTRVLIWGIPSALFVGSLVFIEKGRPQFIKANRFLLFIGEASYSLYLVHQYTFMGLTRLAGRLHLREMNIILFVMITMAAALLSGFLFHIIVEKPLIRKLNKIFLKRRKEPIIVSGAFGKE